MTNLTNLLPTGDKNSDRGLKKAIRRIEQSLAPNLWQTDTTLSTRHGERVFDRSKQAVAELMKVIRKDASLTGPVQAAIDLLVQSDQTLAQAALETAIANNGHRKYIARAQADFNRAAENLAKGQFDKAIDRYGKAWQNAVKALR